MCQFSLSSMRPRYGGWSMRISACALVSCAVPRVARGGRPLERPAGTLLRSASRNPDHTPTSSALFAPRSRREHLRSQRVCPVLPARCSIRHFECLRRRMPSWFPSSTRTRVALHHRSGNGNMLGLSAKDPRRPQLGVRRCKPNQSSGHNQIRIDLHTQPGTLGHGNVALLVD
jgi:hypothetical protein